MIELPTKAVPAKMSSPRRLIIYSPPKIGKTTLVSKLEDCLIIDTENGTEEIEALKVGVKDIYEYFEVLDKVVELGKPYRYIAIDTITSLEDMCLELALQMYKSTPVGKNFTGTNILHLPNGGGYLYLREAFKLAINKAQDACERLILLGHLKESIVNKSGKEVSSKDLDLTGKIKVQTCANASAIGYLYRNEEGVHISFNNTKGDQVVGARPVHLRNKDILISKEIDGYVEAYWDQIFID
jgi:hypothetical protein